MPKLDYKKWCSGNKINWPIKYLVIVSAENASCRSFRLANMFHNKWSCGRQYRLSDRQYKHRHFIQPTEARSSRRNRDVGEVYAEENRCYSLKITTSYPIQYERLTVVRNIRKQLWKSNLTNFTCRLHQSGKKRCTLSLQWSNSLLLIKDFHYARHCESPVKSLKSGFLHRLTGRSVHSVLDNMWPPRSRETSGTDHPVTAG